MDISYVLPILRRSGEEGLDELTGYLRWLSGRVEVIVADGSAPAEFAEHSRRWASFAVHVQVVNRPGRYGKVLGVHAGVAAASHEKVVIADDDVRYTDHGLRQMHEALEAADLVSPQNFFEPLPWYAAWDTARTLLNRAVAADSPGTLGVRRSLFVDMGGYADDVMYENLELIRTVLANGGRVVHRRDLYVPRLPGTARRFWEQRPRQAYDDFAQPAKAAAFLGVLPTLWWLRGNGSPVPVVGSVAAASVGLAWWGRRREGGRAVFPIRAVWLAPVWVLERSLCIWLALFYRLTGGVPYAGTRFRIPAHSVRRLRRGGSTGAVTPVTHGSGARPTAAAEGNH